MVGYVYGKKPSIASNDYFDIFRLEYLNDGV
jgi:hypothetical protein